MSSWGRSAMPLLRVGADVDMIGDPGEWIIGDLVQHRDQSCCCQRGNVKVSGLVQNERLLNKAESSSSICVHTVGQFLFDVCKANLCNRGQQAIAKECTVALSFSTAFRSGWLQDSERMRDGPFVKYFAVGPNDWLFLLIRMPSHTQTPGDAPHDHNFIAFLHVSDCFH